MNLSKRLSSLEAGNQNGKGPLLLIRSYIEPNGEELPVLCYEHPDGEKVFRLPDEAKEELEERVISLPRAKGICGAIEPVIILPDNNRQ